MDSPMEASALISPAGEAPNPDYKLASRVVQYTPVAKIIETSKDVYQWGREASPVIAFVEDTLEGTLQWISPKVEPIFQMAKPLAIDPVMTRVDSLGCSVLDRVEGGAQRVKDTYDSTTTSIGNGIHVVKDATMDRVVSPVDHYLKDSLIAKPITLPLNLTEKVVDKLLPTEEEDPDKLSRGPITKTAYLSQRIPRQIFAKLHEVGSHPPHQDPLAQTVDLLNFASTTLDAAVNAADRTVTKSVQTAQAGATLAMKVPQKAKEITTSATYEALAAIQTVAEMISKQIPSEISTRFNQLTEVALGKEGQERRIFSSVAQSSSLVLKDVSQTIGGYIQRGEKIPQRILSNAYEALQKVTDSLVGLTNLIWKSK